MPIYDYQCPKCQYKELSKLVDKQNCIVICKQCGTKMNKLFPKNIGIQFKGNGWSKDNYGGTKNP